MGRQVRRLDLNTNAFRIVKHFSDQEERDPRKDAASIGGKKGGKARAEVLSPEQKREIAKRAALARWKK